MSVATHRFEGKDYYALAQQGRRPWGRHVRVDVFAHDGALLGSVLYGTHPEFDEFERYEMMDASEFLAIVEERLQYDMQSGSYTQAWPAGLLLLQPINGKRIVHISAPDV